jgi:hypothetical protein
MYMVWILVPIVFDSTVLVILERLKQLSKYVLLPVVEIPPKNEKGS